jgi:GNAT superfamily N-acetyltransferase
MSSQANKVTLERPGQADLAAFKRDLQEAFGVGVKEAFGTPPEEPIPSDEDIEESVNAPGAVLYLFVAGGARVGGAVVHIDEKTQRNSLAFFFVSPKVHGRGIGHEAWLEIEKAHPETKVWVTHTPYFEKRNIHFYVNKCGFKIVEFYNPRHPDPHEPSAPGLPDEEDDDAMFRFEKNVADREHMRASHPAPPSGCR